jgi:hypothetical protein
VLCTFLTLGEGLGITDIHAKQTKHWACNECSDC